MRSTLYISFWFFKYKKYLFPSHKENKLWFHAHSDLLKVHQELIADKVLREAPLTQCNQCTCLFLLSSHIQLSHILCVRLLRITLMHLGDIEQFCIHHSILTWLWNSWQNYFTNANKFVVWLSLSILYLVMNPWIVLRHNSHKVFLKHFGINMQFC